MKRLFTWLVRPAVLSLLGVILLSLIIWYEAPLLAFDGKEPFASEKVRWIWIGVLFLLWAAWWGWKLLSARLANVRLVRGVAGEAAAEPAGAQESRAEVDAMGTRLQEAMEILRKTKPAGKARGQYLYQLPWYMFVGAPGSGKTTALVQSGLNFPLAEAMGKNAIGGVGGTRNCDWWFTDEAVLLDTAGRYTTQDSYAEVDKAAWTGFLQLLRKHRRRRPLNGVIIALSAGDLLQQDAQARTRQAQAIRARIKELHEQLGMRFPIYVMVTKCDLLAGFVEFFDNLGKEERAQVWGMSFPLGDGNQVDQALASFPAEFALLETQLQKRLIGRMQQERDTRRRTLMYSFPQQFAGMGELLQSFLGEIFQSTRYEENAMLRGVYFTSGTQEGSPIDRVMGAMAAAFGLQRQVLPTNAASGRSYFITRLLQEVIFPEADVAGVNLKLEQRRRWLQWGSVAGISLLALLIAGGLLTSYVRNGRLIEEAGRQVAQVNQLAEKVSPAGSAVQPLPLLNAVRTLPAGYEQKDDSVALLMRLGLYQGGKLGAGAQTAYRKALRATLLPRIVKRMEDQLRRGSANSPDYLYELLRVYLMLGDATHFDAESVGAWVELDWRANLTDATPAQREQLGAHLLALLESYQSADTPLQLDAQLVADTRLALARMPVAERVYTRLKRELGRSKLPEFTPAAAGGRDAPQVFIRRSGEPLTRGIPGTFSVAGHAMFKEQSAQAMEDVEKDSWVLALQESVSAPASVEQTRAALLQLYYNDYITAWDALLADVTVAPFASLDQGARIAGVLAGADSPLRKFLLAAAKETKLDAAPAAAAGPAVPASVRLKLDTVKKKLERAFGDTTPAGTAPDAKTQNPVDAHFEDLHKLVAGAPGAPLPLDPILAMLKDAAVYLDAAGAAKRAGTPPPPAEAINRIKLEAAGKPAPLGQMLKSVESGAGGLTLGSERARLNALWQAGPAQFCQQAVAGRYPLVRSATQEVTQDDFGKFFAPGGLADEFFQRILLPYVDMGGRQWKWRVNADSASLGIPTSVLDHFQRAAQVRDAYFGGGGRQASMRFELRPVSADPALTKVTLDVDGQPVLFAAGAVPVPAALQVPSGKGSGRIKLEATPASARSTLQTEGGWAWLRMIDKGALESTPQGERFKLTFDLDGRKVVYTLTASSVINPFRREALEQFRCMGSL